MTVRQCQSTHPPLLRFVVPSLLACCGAATAEETIVVEAEQLTPFMVDEVESVTKTEAELLEIPQSASVVTGEQIERQGLDSFGEVFRYTPGVQGENFGFEPRLTFLRFRGFNAFDDGFFRDGMKLVDPDGGSGYSPEPYGADRVVVLRGPASVLYGNGAPGGLVNYVSKRPLWEPQHELIGSVGNHERFQGRFDSTMAFGSDAQFAYRVTGLVRESETQVDFVDDDRIYLAPAFTWRLDEDSSLTLLAHYQSDETQPSQRYPVEGTLEANPNGEIPTERFTGEPGTDSYERDIFAIGYLFEHRFDEQWSIDHRLRYYGNDIDDRTIFPEMLQGDERTVTRSLFERFTELDSITTDTRAQLDIETGAVVHRAIAGLDLQFVSATDLQNYAFGTVPDLDLFDPNYGGGVPSVPTITDTDSDLQQVGIYLQDEMRFGDGWTAVLGLRHDWAEVEIDDNLASSSDEQDDAEFTYRLGVIYESPVGIAPYASYMTSFLPQIGVDPSGEPFDPETGRQFEVGVKYRSEEWNSIATLGYFHLERENFTTWSPSFELDQEGEARSQGIELEINAAPIEGWNFILSYAYIDTELTESSFAAEEGEPLAYTPEHSGTLWADYSFQDGSPLHGLNIGTGLRYIGESYANLFQERNDNLEVPDQVLVDAAVHYQWQGWIFGLTAHNLFDEQYVASAFSGAVGNFASYGERLSVVGEVGYRW